MLTLCWKTGFAEKWVILKAVYEVIMQIRKF
jgi:hypothetical protein